MPAEQALINNSIPLLEKGKQCEEILSVIKQICNGEQKAKVRPNIKNTEK
jgi:hypothetical protein